MRRSPAVLLVALIACGDGGVSTGFVVASDSAGTSGETGSSGTGSTPTTSATTPTGETGGTGTSTSPPDTGDASSSTGTASSDATTTGETSTSTTGTTGDASTSGPDSSAGSSGPPPPSCDDGEKNQDETDVDCGGVTCEPCANESGCVGDVDCASGWCDAGVCREPECLADSDCDGLDTACTDSLCDVETKLCASVPILEDEVCDDGDACTSGTRCAAGVCTGGVPIDCGGLDNPCGAGACDPAIGCFAEPFPAMDGQACDDGFVCTPDDTCADGLCGVGGPGFVWFEDFTQPDPGWSLEGTWEIGPALASADGKNGADPADDHTPSADEMLAGTVIGGLVPSGAQAKACLTSPAVPTAGQPALWLTFWRHLHTDYYPFISHSVEAYTGDAWAVVELGYVSPGIDDAAWTQVAYDLTPHANADLRVRICYENNNGSKDSAGWSVDDVTLGPFVCTPEG
jgi:hypothetical protein